MEKYFGTNFDIIFDIIIGQMFQLPKLGEKVESKKSAFSISQPDNNIDGIFLSVFSVISSPGITNLNYIL